MIRSLILGLAGILGSGIAQVDSRPPVPAKAELAEAEKLVKSIYKAEFAKTKAADRSALAAKLLEQAADSKDDLKAKYVLLQESRDLATKAGDYEAYLKAADEIAATYKISQAESRASNVDALAAAITGADRAREAGQPLLDAVDAALGAGEFDAGQKLLRATSALGQKSGIAILTTAISLRSKSMTALRKEYEKLGDAQKKLETSPTDGAANLLVGKFLCFVKNDWENGLPRLVLGSDEGLRASAEKDGKAATGSGNDKVEAADSWHKTATDLDPLQKTNLENRALHWYRESLADITGLTKVRIEKRIADLAKAVPAAPAENLAKWTTIKKAIKEGNLKDWQIIGGSFHQKTYREVPPNGAILIGFRYTTLNGRFPDFLQAIYRGPQGESYGAPSGVVKRGLQVQTTKAKAGYAVGAIFTRGGGGFDALQPIFMKMTAAGVDPTDSYKGDHIGGEGGGAGTLGGDGNFIVGIHGKLDNNNKIQAVSPVTLTTNEVMAGPATTPKKKS